MSNMSDGNNDPAGGGSWSEKQPEGSLADSSQDVKDMHLMGKRQQLGRNFSFWSILAFSCVTMLTWSAQLITFIQGLQNGGPGGLVISFLLT
jgi:choline transport protein